MKKLCYSITAIAIALTCVFFTESCSEDTNKLSRLPEFSGISLSSETLNAGETITAIAVQYKKGKYLDRTTYTWTCEGAELSGATTGVFYDSNSKDPDCQIKLPSEPGSYTIKFEATYNFSAKANNSTKEVDCQGGTITYTSSPLTGYVKITRTIRVK